MGIVQNLIEKYHTVGIVQNLIEKYHTVGIVQNLIEKYHTVGIVQNLIEKSEEETKAIPLTYKIHDRSLEPYNTNT